MLQERSLCLSAHDELYVIDLNQVLYLQADDHYTEVYYTSGVHFLVPFGLVKFEAQINMLPEARLYLLRLGRKYIVNTHRIFRINITKELLYLTTDDGNSLSLHITKPVLRSLMEYIREQNNENITKESVIRM